MAKKRIERDDIAPKDIFGNITDGAKEAKAQVDILTQAVKMLKESAKTIKTGLENAKVGDTKGMRDFDEMTRQANATAEAKLKIDKQLLIEKQKLRVANADMNKQIKTEVEATTKLTKAQETELGTLQKLELENRQLRAERAQLNLETKEGTARLKEINDQLDKNNKKIKESGDQLKQQKMNVGNYKDAVSGLKNMLMELGLAFGIGSVIKNAGQTIVDFDQKIADLVSITGASGNDLKFFREQAIELGKSVEGGASAVVEAYKLIGSAKPELLKNAKALDEVTQSAITLAHASGMELPDAATALTDAMNQFGAPAEKAGQFIDALANGALFGSAEIPQVTEALLKFGAVSKTANVSLEESVGLIEALAEKGLKGAEAGTALRNVMLKVSAPDALPKEAQKRMAELGISFEGLSDKSKPFADRLALLKPLLKDTGTMVKVFGTENVVSATNLIQNIDRVKELTDSMDTQGAASKQAEDRTKTLSFAFNTLKESYNAYVLGLNESTGASEKFASIITFLAKNIGVILDTIITGVEIFGLWKIATYTQIVANKLLETSTKDTLTSLKDGFKKIGDVIKENVIGLFITAIVAGLMKLKSMIDEVNAPFERLTELNDTFASITEKASQKLGEEKAQLQLLIGSIKSHNAGSKERGELLDQLNTKYGTHLKNINDETLANKQLDIAQKTIIANMKNQILLEARREKYVEVVKAVQNAEDEYNKAIYQQRAKINKLSDDEVNNWIERLNLASKGSDLAQLRLRSLSMAEKRRFLIENNLSSENLAKKQALEQLQKKELSMEKMLTSEMDKNTDAIDSNITALNTSSSATDEKTDKTKKLKTELEDVNEYLTQQNELLAQIDEINFQNTIEAKQKEIDIKLSNDLAYAKETGQIQVDELENLIDEKYALEEQAIIDRQKNELRLLEEKYTEESRKEREELIKKRDELLAQDGITTEAKIAIWNDYYEKLKQIENNDLQRNADLQLQTIISEEKTKDELVKIEEEKSDEINNVNDQLIAEQEKYYADKGKKNEEDLKTTEDAEKKRYETIKESIDLITDYFTKRADERIAKIQEEIDKNQDQADKLRELANEGNIQAQQSIAEQEKLIAEGELEKQRAEQKKQQILQVTALLEAYTSNMEAGDDSATALGKAIASKAVLDQFIGGLGSFYDGTEDTGVVSNALDSKGGRLAVLHNNERVLTAKQNAKIGNVSNEEVASIIEKKRLGVLTEIGTDISVSNDSGRTNAIVERLESLERAIVNKPETNVELERIVDGAMHILRSRKQGSTTTYNRYRINP